MVHIKMVFNQVEVQQLCSNRVTVIFMYTQASRKYIPNERSVPKSYRKDSDDQYLTSANEYVASYKHAQLQKKSISGSKWDSANMVPTSTYAKRKSEANTNNLKNELQNLKMEVSKLMSKDYNKQGLRTTNKRLSSEPAEHQSENEDYSEAGKQSISDNESVTSYNLIEKPLKEIDRKASSHSYDHAHYMELVNEQLKTELRNLRDKYQAKKKELNQKCQVLEKKNQYLQIHLRKEKEELDQCKKALSTEILVIKKQLQRNQQQEKPTLPCNDDSETNGLLKDKMNRLYSEMTQKNQKINSLSMSVSELEGQLCKCKFQLKKESQKFKETHKEYEFAKCELSRAKQFLENQIANKKDTQCALERVKAEKLELENILYVKDRQVKGSQQLQTQLSQEVEQYQRNENKLLIQIRELKEQNKHLKELCEADQSQILYIKKGEEESRIKIQQLSKKIKAEREQWLEKEDEYRISLQEANKKAEEKLNILRTEYKVLENAKFQEKNADGLIPEENSRLRRELNKWKAEYKLLKIKLQDCKNAQVVSQACDGEYYRKYMDFKGKTQVLQQKLKLANETLERYLEKLTEKEEQYLHIEIEFKKEKNSREVDVKQHNQRVQALLQQIADKDSKIEELGEKLDQQMAYRKEIQNKVLNCVGKESQYYEMMDRIKKRVNEQDEKLSRNIKELKSKETLIIKLRTQIRELIEQTDSKVVETTNRKIEEQMEQYIKEQHSIISQLKGHAQQLAEMDQKQRNTLLEQNRKIKGIYETMCKQFKELCDSNRKYACLYNSKLQEFMVLEHKLQKLAQQAQIEKNDVKKCREQVQAHTQAELNDKKNQITQLRAEVQKLLKAAKLPDTHTFDQTIRRHLEEQQRLQNELLKKNEEIYRLRDNYSTLQNQYSNIKSQLEMLRLKALSQKKNIEVNYQVQLQNLQNKVAMEQKKSGSLEEKVKAVVNENHKKDSFIQNYIMGKKLPTDQQLFLSEFVKKYELSLPTNISLRQDAEEFHKLVDYNFNLMNEIALLKQKIEIYENIDLEQLSFVEDETNKEPEITKDKNSSLNGQGKLQFKNTQSKLKHKESNK